jgi:hypothetical protein
MFSKLELSLVSESFENIGKEMLAKSIIFYSFLYDWFLSLYYKVKKDH